MQRVLKFRAWSKTHKKIFDRVLAGPGDPCSIVWEEDRKEWTHFDEFCGVIMQYTGLKNKHGVEIYEGDIVRVEGTELRTVVYEWASFHLVSSSGSRILFEDTNLETLELVGNIHMHPGLLEKMQKLESESV